MTQYEVAEKLGISRGQLANYEQGSRQPDYDMLEQLADFYSVTTDYLLGRTDDEHGSKPVDDMTDEEIDEEIKEMTKELNVWYKESPKDKREELERIRDIIKLYTKKK